MKKWRPENLVCQWFPISSKLKLNLNPGNLTFRVLVPLLGGAAQDQ